MVAKVDDAVITVTDVQDRINKQSPFVRARYTNADKKKEFLDGLVKFEVMAAEAARRGYDKDPDVQRVMKQQMISKLMQKDFESKLKVEDVPDADVEKYYNEHPAEFHQKDEVRVSEILVKDKGKAERAYAEARALPKGAANVMDQKGFRDLVAKYSEDEESKPRGGDLSFFASDSTTVPSRSSKRRSTSRRSATSLRRSRPTRAGRSSVSPRSAPGSTARWPRPSDRSSSGCSGICARRPWTPSSTTSRRRAASASATRTWPRSWSRRVRRARPPARRRRDARAASGRHTTFRRARRSNPPVKSSGRSIASQVAVSPRVALALALAAVLFTPVAAQARVVERVAAVVGDALVLASEVEDRVGPLMADVNRITDPDKRSARATALRREVLERLIDDELIYQQAAELKLSISSEQVDASIEEIKKQNNLTDEQLREALRGQGMTMASYRADFRRQLLRFRVLNIAVGSRVNISDDEVRAYYERHMKDGSNVQVRASHVYVAIPEGADAAVAAEKQAQAQKILERAQAGEDFAKLARETSDDAATRADGGDLGYFGKDMLPKAIEELVFSMKVGDIRGPIRVDRGFHVIKLVDRKVKDPKPFDEVKDDIRNQLRGKDMERQTKIYLGELRKKTLVDIRY